jgi:hypothetical protein
VVRAMRELRMRNQHLPAAAPAHARRLHPAVG